MFVVSLEACLNKDIMGSDTEGGSFSYYTHAQTCRNIHARTHARTHAHLEHLPTQRDVPSLLPTHIHPHAHTYAHIYTYTHTHINTCLRTKNSYSEFSHLMSRPDGVIIMWDPLSKYLLTH